MAPRWVILTGLLSVAIPRPALGIVILPPARVHDAPLPANGVLLFRSGSAGDMGTVSVSGADGAVVGSTEAINDAGLYFGWRADAPPELGSYDWTLSSDTYLTMSTGDVAIVEAYQPEAHEIDIALTLESGQVHGGEIVCCEPDPETRVLNNGCFYTEVTQGPVLHASYESPLEPAHATQYLYWISDAPETPDNALFDFSVYHVLPSAYGTRVLAADEYCITVKAQSLIDDQVFSTTRCVPHTLPEPTFSPRTDYSYAFNLRQCPEPPQGFENVWCETLGPGCTDDIPIVESSQSIVDACKPVYERCGLKPPELPVINEAEPVIEPESEPDEDQPTFACSCRMPAASSPAAPWLVAVVVALSTARRVRRRGRPLQVS